MMMHNKYPKKNDDKNVNPLKLFDGCEVLSVPFITRNIQYFYDYRFIIGHLTI